MKKHERREVGGWSSQTLSSCTISVYVGGSYSAAEQACREFCFPSGLCVTIERVKYIFGGGAEDGVKVGLIQYPPFPEEPHELIAKATSLGKAIAEVNRQFSFTVVTAAATIFHSRVKQ